MYLLQEISCLKHFWNASFGTGLKALMNSHFVVTFPFSPTMGLPRLPWAKCLLDFFGNKIQSVEVFHFWEFSEERTLSSIKLLLFLRLSIYLSYATKHCGNIIGVPAEQHLLGDRSWCVCIQSVFIPWTHTF